MYDFFWRYLARPLIFAWGRLPLKVIHACGWLLGLMLFIASPSLVRRARANLELAQCGDPNDRPRIIRQSLQHNMAALLDFPCFYQKNPRCCHKAVKATYPMAVNASLALQDSSPKALSDLNDWFASIASLDSTEMPPVLVICGHLGSMEVIARTCAEAFNHTRQALAHASPNSKPFTIKALTGIQRSARSRWMRDLLTVRNHTPMIEAVDGQVNAIRPLLRALKNHGIVWIAADHRPAKGSGEWLNFFGRPAYTMTLAAKLSMMSGVRTLYVEAIQQFGGYRLGWCEMTDTLIQAATAHDHDPIKARAQAINDRIERSIQAHPEHYLWLYDRFRQP